MIFCPASDSRIREQETRSRSAIVVQLILVPDITDDLLIGHFRRYFLVAYEITEARRETFFPSYEVRRGFADEKKMKSE